ncbi:hypothetical protein Mgra_00001508 [Meloidogyne graminicola]|uniref:Uncharacterized protein n=1 Tax=Meloidogyne graminicola TaxID=189291 RepID=A0A8T0A0B8_9BILA|nr:hypothetical protein Mgra_00001508 [Meloidogyne graminicola]
MNNSSNEIKTNIEINKKDQLNQNNFSFSLNKSSIKLKQNLENNKNYSILPALLCFYSFLKEIKVGEPFLFKYQNEYLNLTSKQITGEIYPYTPYAYLAALIPIFLFTDLLLDKLFFVQHLFLVVQLVHKLLDKFFMELHLLRKLLFFHIFMLWTRAGTMAGRTAGYLFSQFLVLSHLSDLYF